MTKLEVLEAEIREEINKEMKHFLKIGQFKDLDDDTRDEAPSLKPVVSDYLIYSSYKKYYAMNICSLRIED